jgi:hypothetical protein
MEQYSSGIGWCTRGIGRTREIKRIIKREYREIKRIIKREYREITD